MNRIALPSVCALLLSGAMAFAQQPQPPASAAQPDPGPVRIANPHKQTAKLAKELNLTPDQTAKIEPVFADRDRKIAALRSDTTLTPEAVKQQMHIIQKSTQAQLDVILTPDQSAQLKAIRRGNNGKAQPQSAPAPPA